jgi:hypothetical protein
MLPFTEDQFFDAFAAYNSTIWPAQAIAYVLAAGLLVMIVTRQPWSWRAAALLLGVFWTWNGLAYHLAFFAPINPAAYGFAALFVAQGAIFLWHVAFGPDREMVIRLDIASVLALTAIGYAMVVYNLIGSLTGHGWPRAPVLGVAPCPTTIFTLGLSMLLERPLPASVVVIPILWALIGSTAAVLLHVLEDLGLLASAAVIIFVMLRPGLHLSGRQWL